MQAGIVAKKFTFRMIFQPAAYFCLSVFVTVDFYGQVDGESDLEITA